MTTRTRLRCSCPVLYCFVFGSFGVAIFLLFEYLYLSAVYCHVIYDQSHDP